jgi:hypothetical protein
MSESRDSHWLELVEPIVCTRDDSLTTTGNQVWTAAKTLFSVLQAAAAASPERKNRRFSIGSNDRILELGAGIGWLAISLAASVRQLNVTATDQRAQLPNLQLNATKFHSRIDARSSTLIVTELDFFSALPPSETDLSAAVSGVSTFPSDLRWSVAKWSLVIASDVVFSLDLARAFAATVARILDDSDDERCCMLYCHTMRRYDDVDRELFRALRASRLAATELSADDGISERAIEAPGDQVDVDEFELFGEQRMVVLVLRPAAIGSFDLDRQTNKL